MRDYLDTVEPGTDHSRWEVEIVPEIGGIEIGGSVDG